MYAWEILSALGHLSSSLPPAHPCSGSERRKEVRYIVSEPAVITVSQPAEFQPIEGELVDVSRSGLKVRAARIIHRGANLHVQLKHMVVFGRACYCREVEQEMNQQFDIGIAIEQVVIAPGAKEEMDRERSHSAQALRQFAPLNMEVLLVEDNPGDVRLTELMLEATGVPHHLTVLTDGAQALERLLNPAEPKPALMLLDLNLPKVSGLKVLECLRQDQAFASVPVAILSSSAVEREVRRSRELGVLAYFEKPMDCAHMQDLSVQVGALMTSLIH